MPPRRTNTQMFALPGRPPETIDLRGATYRLVRVFKHDFFAATCLYETPQPCELSRIVVKFARRQPFCGLPARWMGRMMADHEQAIYRALEGVVGVPKWAGRLDENVYAIEYVDAVPLDHMESPPGGFFDRLGDLFDAVHLRGIGYCDANKRSNILVGEDGRAFLVDFQLSIRLRDDLPWPVRQIMRAVVNYIAERDLYHICKHKRRLAPAELTEEEEKLSRRRSGLHLLHRKLTKPWRAIRRRFLRRQYRRGRLLSPTAELESHHQPEKETWRRQDDDAR